MSGQDLRTALDFIRGLYASADVPAFVRHVTTRITSVVPADIVVYNEVDLRTRRASWVERPAISATLPDALAVFERHLPEHPFTRHFAQVRRHPVVKFSDFVTRRQLHDLGIYHEFFRRLSVEHQMSVSLRVRRAGLLGLALNRERPDFSERDRMLLGVLRPHLVQAYRNAEAAGRLRDELAWTRDALEALGGAVVRLRAGDRIAEAPPGARRLLAQYFGAAARRSDRLPGPVRDWLGRRPGLGQPVAPLVVPRDGRRLVVRVLGGDGARRLLLEEQLVSLAAASLEPLGLSRREAEVLRWVAGGKGSQAIAAILGLSVRTVHTHLQRIYEKLGVESRTAAAARAYEMAGVRPI